MARTKRPVETGVRSGAAWARRIIPLPKELEVEESLTLKPERIALVQALDPSPPVETALKILGGFARAAEEESRTAWLPAAGRQRRLKPRGAVRTARKRSPLDDPDMPFTLLLALSDERAFVPARLRKRLDSLPNRDQAYAIFPFGGGGMGSGLVLVGNTPNGLLYAALTLSQLVGSPVGSEVEIPLVRIVDWPDLSERGQWGGNSEKDLGWTWQWKLNVLEANSQAGTDEAGNPVVKMSRDLFRQGRELGVKVVPFILHLEQIAQYAGLTRRADVTGTPDPSKPLPSDYVPGLCMSSPATRELIGKWLAEAARIEGVSDIQVWLSEDAAPCFCEKCIGKEPFTLEVACIVSAFEKAKEVNPAARLRILTTQGSYAVNDRILAAAPADVGITYYHGGYTYDSSRKPMIYPLLEDFARSGRWLGVYPQITHCWRTVFPWTAPSFIHYRASEFVEKKLRCMIGYAVPSNRFHEFNVMAMAEWTWNSSGRSPEEFARAYATARKVCDPDLFARWALEADEAGWALAESRLFLRLIYNPELPLSGDSPFRKHFAAYAIGEPSRLRDTIAIARRALKLARQAGVPDMIDESECVLAGLEALRALNTISDLRQRETLTREGKRALVAALESLDSAARIVQTRLMRWGKRICAPEAAKLPGRLRDTANVLLRTCDAAWAFAASAGIPDPCPAHRLRKLGRWSAQDFAGGPNATLVFAVHDLATPGSYDVSATFDGGMYGADVTRVALVSEDASGHLAVLAETEDILQRVSRWESWHEFRLEVPEVPAGSRLALEIGLLGIPKDAPSDRRTCSGTVGLRRAWEP